MKSERNLEAVGCSLQRERLNINSGNCKGMDTSVKESGGNVLYFNSRGISQKYKKPV